MIARLFCLAGALLVVSAHGGAAGPNPVPGYLIRPLPSPAGAGSGQPHLAVAPDDTVVLSWLEPDGDGHRLLFSRLEGEDWSAPQAVAGGSDWFVNWADFPSVVPITDELWAAHWLARSGDATYAYDVMLSVSRDGGESWSSPFSAHADGTPTEHGFVTLFPWRDAIGVVWLDGRNMVGDHGEDGGHDGGMTLRSALVSVEGEILERQLVDDLVCDCCQTDAVVTGAGPVVAYRDRTVAEIRDIQVRRAGEAGWEEPVTVNADGWEIAACPVNGPALSTNGRQIDAVWYTAAGGPEVRFARSYDDGASFTSPVTVDVTSDDVGAPWGRVDVVTLDDGSSVVSHVAHAGPAEGRVSLSWVSPAGESSSTGIVLPNAEPARQVGFPQLARDGSDLIVAWTAAEGDGHRVRTVRLTGRR